MVQLQWVVAADVEYSHMTPLSILEEQIQIVLGADFDEVREAVDQALTTELVREYEFREDREGYDPNRPGEWLQPEEHEMEED